MNDKFGATGTIEYVSFDKIQEKIKNYVTDLKLFDPKGDYSEFVFENIENLDRKQKTIIIKTILDDFLKSEIDITGIIDFVIENKLSIPFQYLESSKLKGDKSKEYLEIIDESVKKIIKFEQEKIKNIRN